jgi:EAL domain-containing protein (putative c-di-GMP-specific phosphodiesterase class I)
VTPSDPDSQSDTRSLLPHFQPIAQLNDGKVYGHEALIRVPPGHAWSTPDAQFAAAHRSGLTIDLELECVPLALYHWGRHTEAGGKLFVNP